MFMLVLFSILLALIVGTMVVFAWKAVQARSAVPVTVPASVPPAAGVVVLVLLGILAALGVKWAHERRKRLVAANDRR